MIIKSEKTEGKRLRQGFACGCFVISSFAQNRASPPDNRQKRMKSQPSCKGVAIGMDTPAKLSYALATGRLEADLAHFPGDYDLAQPALLETETEQQ